MKYEHDIVLNCLVIYSHQDCDKDLTKKHFTISCDVETNRLRPEKGYVKFYKLGVGLPEKIRMDYWPKTKRSMYYKNRKRE